MSIEFSNQSLSKSISAAPSTGRGIVEAEVLVVFLTEGGVGSGGAKLADTAMNGLLSKLATSGEITGKRYECTTLLSPPGVPCQVVVVVGLGLRELLNIETLYKAAATASRMVAARPRGSVAFLAEASWTSAQVEQAVAGAAVGMVGQDLYRAEKKRNPFGKTIWLDAPMDAVQRGAIIADGVNLARRLVNMPPDVLYPESFAEEARVMAERTGVEIEIWDEKKLLAERCGSLLAVGRGSAKASRLVILRYKPAGNRSPQPEFAIVGKGVTFDSGGLSLKPADSMLSMKCDMSGGAAAIAAIATIAALRLPIHVIAAVGMVENMTGSDAYRVGDVLIARSGTTIEVHNTDAEGRLVLADVLDVVKGLKPDAIVDAATLTGACVVALGNDVAGLFSNNQPWCDRVAAAARRMGEAVWQMPMYSDYDDQIKSDVADIKNVGDGRWGGAITAAKFLERFVGEIPWTHVDIAGPAFVEKPKPWTDGGGSGCMVRSFVEIARGS